MHSDQEIYLNMKGLLWFFLRPGRTILAMSPDYWEYFTSCHKISTKDFNTHPIRHTAQEHQQFSELEKGQELQEKPDCYLCRWQLHFPPALSQQKSYMHRWFAFPLSPVILTRCWEASTVCSECSAPCMTQPLEMQDRVEAAKIGIQYKRVGGQGKKTRGNIA